MLLDDAPAVAPRRARRHDRHRRPVPGDATRRGGVRGPLRRRGRGRATRRRRAVDRGPSSAAARRRSPRSSARSRARTRGSPASAASSRPTRANAEPVEWDEKRGDVEVQPARRLDREGPLARASTSATCPTTRCTTSGYASIGCAPCTLPGAGREGRWAGTDKIGVRAPRCRPPDGPARRPLRPRRRHPGRHDRHRRRLADDAAADPRLRRQAGRRDRHRPRLRRDHQDRRRLAPLAQRAPSTSACRSGWRSARVPGALARRRAARTACDRSARTSTTCCWSSSRSRC